MHRAVSRWLGSEAEACGPDLTGVIELVPLGRGGLLARHRFSPPDERWQVQADGTFAMLERSTRPTWTQAGTTLLPDYGGSAPESLLLLYYPKRSAWALYYASERGLHDGETATWTPRQDPQPIPWNDSEPRGRRLLGIDADVVLDRNLGDGSTRFWRFVNEAGTRRAEPLLGLAGGPRDAFRRGHRVVALGQGRLLEWMPAPCDASAAAAAAPACAAFNVWSYSLADAGAPGEAPRDPFQPAPVVSGLWPQVGAAQTLVSDESHLYVWTRASGRLQTYRLDAAAPDPLAPSLLLHDQTLPELASVDWDPPTRAPGIKRLVLVLQDGRSFDSYFGAYCRGAPGPGGDATACEEGPGCCEAMPASIAAACTPLDPTAEPGHKPDGEAVCMRLKMNGGAMDRFAVVNAGGCGGPADMACAGAGDAAGAVGALHALAGQGALADRFFQSYAFVDGDGADGGVAFSPTPPESHNLLYLTATRFGGLFSFLSKPLLDHELSRMETTWAIYGGKARLAGLRMFGFPDFNDPDWTPYRALEAGELESDLATGELPAVSIVLPDADDRARSDAPGHRFDAAFGYVRGLVDAVTHSPRYGADTLVLLTYLTAGGHYDHVRPPDPPPPDVDSTLDPPLPIHYGPRVPLLALGPLARGNHVSHVQMELSSIAAFVEWNWLYGVSLKGSRDPDDPRRYRDVWANGIGSLLDPALGVPAGPR